jgi:hypothetical protein
MGKTTLVDHRIEEGRKLVDLLTREGRLEVTAAYWIMDLADQEWTFPIVTPTYEEQGEKDPRRVINSTLREHPEIDLDSGDIRPRPPEDRKVVEIVNYLRNYPAAEAFRLGGVGLKGRWVETSYIYPIKLDDMMVSANRNDN